MIDRRRRGASLALLLCLLIAACSGAGDRPLPGPQSGQASDEMMRGSGRGNDGGGGGGGGAGGM